ncbi:hypothetical protein [Botrimarina sp.]|uniref:hypothetical protein n=1 Tax=Botrimarina sp. TaxID=2795802 RepID=UPI0032F03E64
MRAFGLPQGATALAAVVVGIQVLSFPSAFGQEHLVPAIADPKPFRVGDLRFVHPPPSKPHDKEGAEGLEGLASVPDVIDTAFPSSRIEALIDDQLPSHRLHFRDAALIRRRHGGLGWPHDKPSYLWLVSWEIFPSEAGFTGAPWVYQGIATGSGELIPPEVSLWSAFPVNGEGLFIRSEFALENRDPTGEEGVLLGEQIAELAKKTLSEFSDKHSLESVGSAEESRGQGEALRWRLQTQGIIRLGEHRAWEMGFTDANWEPCEALEYRSLKVWATLDGELSKLSLGGE